MHKPGFLKLTTLIALVFATAPASAVTKLVNFSFTAGGNAAKGVYTLDCPAPGGNCAVVALTGSFGGSVITLAPPPPAGPPPPVKPDNEVTQPGYKPSEDGVGIQKIDSFFDVFVELTIDGGKTWMVEYDPTDYEPVGPTFDITDYHASVPEPASWALMLLGFGLIGAAIRRNAKPSGSSLCLTLRHPLSSGDGQLQ